MAGKLILVPTPIGNLGDITLRAIETLKEADVILAEDTRTSGNLLRHLGISKPLKPYHQHNEHRSLQEIMHLLESGQTVALVSDAGTPAISDPGFLVTREAVRLGYDVQCLPGPTAFVPALVCSGFPCNEFVFIGFLPQKKGRQTKLRSLAEERRTFILYESPFRLVKLLQELSAVLGADREASVSREISKLYEETKRGSLQDLHAHYTAHPPKGEIVVVVKATDPGRTTDDSDE